MNRSFAASSLSSTNSAIDAVNACNALRPRSDRLPSGEETGEWNVAEQFLDRRRVVVGDPNIRRPPVAGEQQAPAGGWAVDRRPLHGQAQVLSAPGASRTWNCGLADLDDLSDFVAPVDASAPSSPRIMKSP